MNSLKGRISAVYVAVLAAGLLLLNLGERFINEKLMFNGVFFQKNLTISCIFRVVIFLLVIVLSIALMRLALKAALCSVKNAKEELPVGFFGKLFFALGLLFFVYAALRMYFLLKALDIQETSLMFLGINEFYFEIFLMRIFIVCANIIYALSGICAINACFNSVRRTTLNDNDNSKKEN